MICWRIVDHTWSAEVDILNGKGAFANPGRWNKRGLSATYTGMTIEVAAAEKGFYRIRQVAERMLVARDSREKRELKKLLKGQSMILAKIEVSDSLAIKNTTVQSNLSDELTAATLPSFTIEDARRSPHDLLPGEWTKQLGSKVAKSAAGLRALSARSNISDVLVLYPTSISPEAVRVLSIQEILLQGVTSQGTPYFSGADVDPSRLLLNLGHSNQKMVDVLHFPFNLTI